MKWATTQLTKRLNIKFPIIQAPMAGNTTTHELFKSVTKSGALSSLGGAYYSPQKLYDEIVQIKSKLEQQPFNINLFAPSLSADLAPNGKNWMTVEKKLLQMNEFLNTSFRSPMGLPTKQLKDFSFHDDHLTFEQQCEAVLSAIQQSKPSSPNVFSFTFGVPSDKILQKFRDADFYIIGTATTVEEAIVLEKSGVDAIVLQGSEAGGHRGTFLPYKRIEDALVPTETLVRDVRNASCSTPIIASGGISTSDDVVKFLQLGCIAVQIGTAFLTCSEASTPQSYRNILLDHVHKPFTPVFTPYFSGRPARAIPNEFHQILESKFAKEDLPPFPFQHVLTSDIRAASAKEDGKYFHLWAGESVRMCKNNQSATQFIEQLVQDVNKTF